MANVTNGDMALVTFRGLLCGQTIMNIFGYRIQSLTGTPTITAWATALKTALMAGGGLKSRFLACCPTQYLLRQLWVQIIAPTRYSADLFEVDEPGLFPDSQAETANVSSCLVRRGDYANRSNVSTLHIPCGTNVEMIDDGFITQNLKDAMGLLAVQVIAPVTTAGTVSTVVPVIPTGGVPAAAVNITKSFPMDTVRVMRRRTVGLGI